MRWPWSTWLVVHAVTSLDYDVRFMGSQRWSRWCGGFLFGCWMLPCFMIYKRFEMCYDISKDLFHESVRSLLSHTCLDTLPRDSWSPHHSDSRPCIPSSTQSVVFPRPWTPAAFFVVSTFFYLPCFLALNRLPPRPSATIVRLTRTSQPLLCRWRRRLDRHYRVGWGVRLAWRHRSKARACSVSWDRIRIRVGTQKTIRCSRRRRQKKKH